MQKIPVLQSTRSVAALLATAALMPLLQAGEGDYPSGLAGREAIRRQQSVAESDQLLLDGRTAYASGDYEKAVNNYKQALAILPHSPVLADRRASITQHLSDGSIALAGKYRKVGKYTEARALLEGVLAADVDPNNPLAKKEMGFLDDPIRTNPALTYEHTQNVDAVRRALYMGEGQYNLGKFDAATKEFEKVLRIDPYNTAARRWMERVASAKSNYYKSAYDHTRAELLSQVDAAWELAVPDEAPAIVNSGGLGQENIGSAYIKKKLQTIIIPAVDFEDISVEEAVDFLRMRSKELDNTTANPAEKGVNFVVRKPRSGGEAPAAAPTGDAPAAPALGAPDPNTLRIKQLRLSNTPLETVLRYVCDQARLKYKTDDFAVTIVPISDEADDIVTRTFNVPPDFQDQLSAGSSEGGEAPGGADPFTATPNSTGARGLGPKKDVVTLLKGRGVGFPEGTSALFSGANSTLLVRNTPTNMDLIQDIINGVTSSTPKQINITTKFVEISQENSEELGFDWVLQPFGIGYGGDLYAGGGTVGSGTPRTNADFLSYVGGETIDGIPAQTGQNVYNLMTAGNRSGTGAITRDSIDSILNNPNRSSQSSAVAPGILSLTGLFTDGQVQMIMRGLSQKKGADVMTAPSIMARPNEEATIEIIREFIYPTEYEPPELPNSVGATGGFGGGLFGGGGSAGMFPVTPATPTAFEPRNTGVTLSIKPTLDGGNSIISLQFKPEIVEFEGFINYGSPIQSPSSDALGNPTTVTITENRIEMPVFSVRRVTTNLSIFDGHTVAVGGLMREDVQNVEDKVPILGDIPYIGRLFQTKAENRIKSNLIVFVTAKIIDGTGRLLKESNPTQPVGGADMGLLPPPQ